MRHIQPAPPGSDVGFTPQLPDEATPTYLARLRLAYSRTQGELFQGGYSHMLPHPDSLVTLIYTTALRKYTQKARHLLKTEYRLR